MSLNQVSVLQGGSTSVISGSSPSLPSLVVQPLGTGADDWPRFMAIVNANAYKKQIVMGTGTWQCKSVIQMVPGVQISCEPGVVIQCTLTQRVSAPSPYNAPFSYDVFNQYSAVSTTLASGPALFATTISVASINFAPGSTAAQVGDSLAIQDSITTGGSHQTQCYQIMAISGTTITVDRPLVYAFPNGCNVQWIVRAKDIKLYGNGAVIQGTFERAITASCAWRAYAEDWTIIPTTPVEYACSFDTGSYDSHRKRIRVFESYTSGMAVEGCEFCNLYDCDVTTSTNVSTTNAGILFQAAYNCHAVNCNVMGRSGAGGAGILFGFNNDVIGCRQCSVQGGSYLGNLLGIQVSGSSTDLDIVGVDISGSIQHGVFVQKQSSTLAPARVRMIGGTLRQNGQDTTGNVGGAGFYADGVLGCEMIGVKTYLNGGASGAISGGAFMTTNGAEMRADSCYFEECTIVNSWAVKTLNSADVVRINNCTIKSTGSFNQYGIWVLSGDVQITNCTFNFTAQTGTYILQQAGTARIGGCTCLIGCSNGVNWTAGTMYRLDGGQGFSVCTTPWPSVTAGSANFGTFTLNGITEVDVNGAFPVYAPIVWSLKTLGSTPNLALPYFDKTQVANHFYVKGVVASANDVFNWQALV